MRIAGVTVSEDDRLAVDVARERGIEITPFQRVPGEKWGEFALRTGRRRSEVAKSWWELNQRLDTLYGLPRSPEPDWSSEQTLARWDPPWLAGAELAALRTGKLPGPVLVQRLTPWEQLQTAIERLSPPPAVAAGSFADRANMVDAALAALLPEATIQLAKQASSAKPRRGMTGERIEKYVRKGFDLAWKTGKVVLKKAGEKLIPIYDYVDTTMDVYEALQWIDRHTEGIKASLPTREYQFDSNTWIYRWPSGDKTAAPPP